jgi:hypothetical protein
VLLLPAASLRNRLMCTIAASNAPDDVLDCVREPLSGMRKADRTTSSKLWSSGFPFGQRPVRRHTRLLRWKMRLPDDQANDRRGTDSR